MVTVVFLVVLKTSEPLWAQPSVLVRAAPGREMLPSPRAGSPQGRLWVYPHLKTPCEEAFSRKERIFADPDSIVCLESCIVIAKILISFVGYISKGVTN